MNKTQYHIRNWSDYNRSLKERGSIDLWFDEKALKNWHPKLKKHKRGRPLRYTEAAILCALTLRYVYGLPFRQLHGFMKSLIWAFGYNIEAPDYTTVCKRQKATDVELLKHHRNNRKLYLLFDSSGFKIFGEGEWKVRKHGYSKRRTWRKVHIGVGITATGEKRIEIMKLTDKDEHDSIPVPEMLKGVQGKVDKILGDGAYDTQKCYEAALEKQAKLITPPRKGANTRYLKNGLRSPPFDERNKHVRFVRKFGIDSWKKATNYHKRSLVENEFFRLKID